MPVTCRMPALLASTLASTIAPLTESLPVRLASWSVIGLLGVCLLISLGRDLRRGRQDGALTQEQWSIWTGGTFLLRWALFALWSASIGYSLWQLHALAAAPSVPRPGGLWWALWVASTAPLVVWLEWTFERRSLEPRRYKWSANGRGGLMEQRDLSALAEPTPGPEVVWRTPDLVRTLVRQRIRSALRPIGMASLAFLSVPALWVVASYGARVDEASRAGALERLRWLAMGLLSVWWAWNLRFQVARAAAGWVAWPWIRWAWGYGPISPTWSAQLLTAAITAGVEGAPVEAWSAWAREAGCAPHLTPAALRPLLVSRDREVRLQGTQLLGQIGAGTKA